LELEEVHYRKAEAEDSYLQSSATLLERTVNNKPKAGQELGDTNWSVAGWNFAHERFSVQILPAFENESKDGPPAHILDTQTGSTMQKSLLLTLLALSTSVTSAQNCISLSGSKTCPAFNASSISTDSYLVGL
jgi:hypothetical protein